jgi:pyruvate dehydrogenase E1 component alpha subunit
MTLSNSNSPLARREALSNRVEQLRRMVEIRSIENRIQKLFAEGHVRGSTHLANGQEAVAVGVARSIDPDDVLTCTYRGHGHALALGVTPAGVIGEICGRTIGCAGGLGGSMHLVEPSVGLLPTAAIIGAGLPIACGAAMAARARNNGRVAVSVFGDGSANIGAFHEALNFAAVQKLPVVFVCENNLYGEYSRIELTTPIEDIAVRAGTYRYSGHSRSDPATYRPAGELDAWLKRDPIVLFADRLMSEKTLAADGLEQIQSEMNEAIEKVVAEVLESPPPALNELFAHVSAQSPGGDQRFEFWRK